jgi:hypothetical protein
MMGAAGVAPLLGLGIFPACRGASAPEWLQAAGSASLGDFGRGSAAVVVERREEFTVDSAGRFVERKRAAIRILNRRAAEPYTQVTGYENSFQSVTQIKAWTIAPGGKVIETGKKDFATVAGFGDFEMYSDDRAKVLTTPSVEDGALVGYEVTREGREPLNSRRFSLEGEIPIWLSELRVSAPSGSLRYFVNFPDRVEVSTSDINTATFRVRRRAAIQPEEKMPPSWSVGAAVFVNYDPNGSAAVQSWDSAGRMIQPYFSSARKLTPEIEAEAQRLATGRADMAGKLDAITDFVSRKIRYVAVEIGIGSFRPHPASDVYHFRYGDCKDKATLLMTMLDHVGLHGYPALIGTRGQIEANPNAPTLTVFNHMIVALPVPEALRESVGKFPSYDSNNGILWIDPTSESHPLGQLPEMDQGVYALVSYPDRGEITRTPETPAASNGVEYRAHLRLDTSGKGNASVEVRYIGDANASRHGYYRDQSRSELRKIFEGRIARYVNQASLVQANLAGLDDNRQGIVEQFSFTGDFAGASAGSSWFFQPLFLSGMSGTEVSPTPRVHPLDLGAPRHVRGEYSIELPAGMRIEQLPEAVTVSSEFGTIQVEYAFAENTLTAIHALSFASTRIPPEKYANFREFVNRAARLGRQRLRMAKE